MNPANLPLRKPATESDVTIRDVEQVERALIDASTRLPVLFFYASAIVWLLLGTLLAGLTSFKLQLSYLGSRSAGPYERDGLRLGVDGWNWHSHLADGPSMSHDFAASTFA